MNIGKRLRTYFFLPKLIVNKVLMIVNKKTKKNQKQKDLRIFYS